ncbi:Uncharacterised protein [Bordetella holmesii]|nr:Uncharacterised protein [Bordetella holmesii]
MACQGTRGQRGRVGHRVLHHGDGLALVFLDLVLREAGVAHHIQHQRHHVGQVLAERGDVDHQVGAAAIDGGFGLQLIQAVLDGLARQLVGAAVEQGGRGGQRHALAAQRFGVAELDQQFGLHAVAARGLGSKASSTWPLGRSSVRRRVRLSILAGDGSKASTALKFGSPL